MQTEAPDPGLTWPVLAAVSVGGVAGSLARYALSELIPHPLGNFPWATFGINVSGCLLIGVVMVLVTDVWPGRTLLRAFLGPGMLGGYTTFSAYSVDAQQLLAVDEPWTALTYLAGTLLAALVAVYVGIIATQYALRRRR